MATNEPTPAQQPDGGAERRQVSPGDLGTPIRFEIETDEGWIIRFIGPEAAAHARAIDSACALASVRGMSFPNALPTVSRAPIPPASPREAVYRAVDAFLDAPEFDGRTDTFNDAMRRLSYVIGNARTRITAARKEAADAY